MFQGWQFCLLLIWQQNMVSDPLLWFFTFLWLQSTFSTKMLEINFDCSSCEYPELMALWLVFPTTLFFQPYMLLPFLAMSAQWNCCWNITHMWMLWMSWNTLHFSEPVRWDTKKWYRHSLEVSCQEFTNLVRVLVLFSVELGHKQCS